MGNKYVLIGSLLTLFILLFFGLHSNPEIALRTHVFVNGYPIQAISTEIEDDVIHLRLETESEQFYILTKPPVERVTQNEMSSYKVSQVGFLYFAQYHKEA